MKNLKTEGFYNPMAELFSAITENGGFVNCLSYPARAYTITPDLLNEKVNLGMEFKAPTALHILCESSQEEIAKRIETFIQSMKDQGCNMIGCCVDIHPIIGRKALDILLRAREGWAKEGVEIVLIGHPLMSTNDDNMQNLYMEVASELDILGSATFREKGDINKHFEFMFDLAENNGKRIQFQVDQGNYATEKETCSLVNFMEQNSFKGKNKVYVAYATSTSCLSIYHQEKLYEKMAELGIGLVVCPSAQISTEWNNCMQAYGKNAIINLQLILKYDVTIGLGTANIDDIHMPLSTGGVGREITVLADATRFYDIQKLAEIASLNGRKILLGQ